MKALKITALVLFLLILAFFGFQTWLGGKIARVIEEKGSEMDGGIYTVTVDRSSVNLFGRSATLRGLKLVPDRERLEGEGRPDMIYEVSIDGVSVTGLNLKLLKGGQGAKLRSVTIDKPLIKADVYRPREEKPATPEDSTEAKKPFDIPVRRVILRDGNIIYRVHEDGMTSYTEADGIDADISLARALADTLTIREMADGQLSFKTLLMTNADGSVDTKLDTLNYDSGKGELRIAAVTVTPKYPMEEFVYKSAKHTDWTELWARDIHIGGLDALVGGEAPYIKADSIIIGSGHVDSYKDRNATVPYRYKNLLYESVQQLPFLLETGKIVVATMDATYRELPQFGTEPGIIRFTNLSGVFDGLTNVPGDEPFYTLSAHGLMYGSASLRATFWFPAEKKNDRFEVKGTLGRTDLRMLNQMVIPLAKAEIEDGAIDGLEFHMIGNTGGASVNLTMLYHGLKIALVKIKDNEVKERKFISWIANEFVVKESNPDGRGETRHGSGTAERDPNRSQFNLLWKTLLQGIKETAI